MPEKLVSSSLRLTKLCLYPLLLHLDHIHLLLTYRFFFSIPSAKLTFKASQLKRSVSEVALSNVDTTFPALHIYNL